MPVVQIHPCICIRTTCCGAQIRARPAKLNREPMRIQTGSSIFPNKIFFKFLLVIFCRPPDLGASYS
jgi:hypothetical protein